MFHTNVQQLLGKMEQCKIFYIGVFSPGPMSEMTSDLRVRGRGIITVTSNPSYAADSYFTNKGSGSDSKIRSDFRHWTKALTQ